MSEIILSTEVYYTDGTIHPFGVDSVPTLEKAVAAMSVGFGMKMKTGTIMTARAGSETGKLILVGSVIGTRPFNASVFGHDFVVAGGELYNRNNFSLCPRKLGVPARDCGDKTWISYLSPKFDEHPTSLSSDYINSAYYDSNDMTWSWSDRTHTVIQKALRPIIDIGVSVIREVARQPTQNSQNEEQKSLIIDELMLMCEDLIKLEDGNISKGEFAALRSPESLIRMQNITRNSAHMLSPNYDIMPKWVDLGRMLRSCFFGCNNDSYHFHDAISLASNMAGKAYVASEIRKAVGLADMVYAVILGKAFRRPE